MDDNNTHVHTSTQDVKAPRGLQLAPYGKRAFTRIKAGWRPSNGFWVYSGAECFDLAREDTELYPSSRAALALPQDIDPEKLYWPDMCNIPVLIVCAGHGCTPWLRRIVCGMADASAGRITILTDGGVIPISIGGDS